MFQAFRVGLKTVVRRPVLSVAIVVPLALATAVSTALFSIADGLYFRPLPLRNVESTLNVSLPASGSRRTKFNDILARPAARMGLQGDARRTSTRRLYCGPNKEVAKVGK